MSVARVLYKKNKHQRVLQDDLTTKFLHLSCGFGGGKSYGLLMKGLQLSYLNKDIPGGLVCPSHADYKKDIEPLFEEILEDNKIRYKYHKTDKWFRFGWSKGKIYIISAEKKIRGPNWGFALLNEVTLISHDRYKDVVGRVRIKNTPYPQIVSSGTPEGTTHWLYEKFIADPMRRSKLIYGDTRDNAMNLNEDYIPSLEDSYDSIMLDAYLKGLFVNMISNRFYYAYDPIKNDDESITRDPDKIVHVALDFNVDPMCASLWHVIPLGNKRYAQLDRRGFQQHKFLCFGEIELKGGQGADTYKMIEALKARNINPTNCIIYPDPAGKARNTAARNARSDIRIIEEERYKVRFRSKAPLFRKRQLATNNLLDKALIVINPKTAPGVKRDFEAVAQDIATFEKMKNDKQLTHFSDGVDYMVELIIPESGDHKRSGMIRLR